MCIGKRFLYIVMKVFSRFFVTKFVTSELCLKDTKAQYKKSKLFKSTFSPFQSSVASLSTLEPYQSVSSIFSEVLVNLDSRGKG
jgi:hypothetical protein